MLYGIFVCLAATPVSILLKKMLLRWKSPKIMQLLLYHFGVVTQKNKAVKSS